MCRAGMACRLGTPAVSGQVARGTQRERDTEVVPTHSCIGWPNGIRPCGAGAARAAAAGGQDTVCAGSLAGHGEASAMGRTPLSLGDGGRGACGWQSLRAMLHA